MYFSRFLGYGVIWEEVALIFVSSKPHPVLTASRLVLRRDVSMDCFCGQHGDSGAKGPGKEGGP